MILGLCRNLEKQDQIICLSLRQVHIEIQGHRPLDDIWVTFQNHLTSKAGTQQCSVNVIIFASRSNLMSMIQFSSSAFILAPQSSAVFLPFLFQFSFKEGCKRLITPSNIISPKGMHLVTEIITLQKISSTIKVQFESAGLYRNNCKGQKGLLVGINLWICRVFQLSYELTTGCFQHVITMLVSAKREK